MLKKVLVSSLSAFTLLMSGCGGDSAGESSLEVQKMLDKGDFTGVISKLESSANNDNDYLALGSAYMGKAGFTLSDIVGALASSDTLGQGDAFVNYIKTVIGNDPSPTAYTDLDNANIYYTKVVADACVSNQKVLTSTEKDICLYIGLALTTKAATTIDLLTENLASLGTGEVDTKLQASACAMQYVLDARKVDGQCSISTKSSVTFVESQNTYGRISVFVNGESNDFLLTNNNKSTLLTVGYCPNDDFSKRQNETKSGYFPCPINETKGSDDVTTGGVLVDTLNEGLGLVKTVAPSDMQSDVAEMKCDLLGGDYIGNICTEEGKITEQVVIDFLNKNN